MEPFARLAPASVEQAARAATATVAGLMGEAAQASPAAAVVKAGGIDLLDLMKQQLLSPASLVALDDIGELDRITEGTGGTGLRIGARVTLQRLAADAALRRHYPALAQAAEGSASPQIRQVATVAGNLLQRPRCWYFRSPAYPCLRKGGTHCFALGGCNAYHAVFDNRPCAIVHPSTLATALVALNARIERIGRSGGPHVEPLEDFFVGVRTDARRENRLAPGEIVTALLLPAAPDGSRSAHLRLSERQAFDWPLVDVATVLQLDAQQRCRAASVVLGAVAPVPHRAHAAEQLLLGQRIDETSAAQAGKAALDGAAPLAGNAYKLPLIETLVKRALLQACAQQM
ncbi:FAD binding domain-containing protein [Aquabacterium sp.]|uniref:FAD binding domain-containing protein n=1 Tax=Aquabacterium sp. TaxID=1872578 RepID=UPI003782F978